MSDAKVVEVAAGEAARGWLPGDVLVAVNLTEQPADFRAGLKGYGRILHCDADLNIKRELHTGRDGLVIGLCLAPDGRLFVTSPQLYEMDVFDAGMAVSSVKKPLTRRYGNLVADRRGGILVGVHSGYGDPEGGYQDALGEGHLIRFDPDTGEAESFELAVDGGRGGRHYVSSLAQSPDGRLIFYTSEAGKRVLVYDLELKAQRPDFYQAGEGDPLTYGLDVDGAGNVFLATGDGATLFDPHGAVLKRFTGSVATGWTRASFALDGCSFFFSNFLEGILERRDLATGEVLARLETGLSGAVTSTIEVPAGFGLISDAQ